MAGGRHPKRGPGVPLGQRLVAGRDHPPGPVVVSEAYRRLMGWEHLDLAHQHVTVAVEDGPPCAGLLLEVAGDEARVMMVRDEDGTLMETWVAATFVKTVRADPPAPGVQTSR